MCAIHPKLGVWNTVIWRLVRMDHSVAVDAGSKPLGDETPFLIIVDYHGRFVI